VLPASGLGVAWKGMEDTEMVHQGLGTGVGCCYARLVSYR